MPIRVIKVENALGIVCINQIPDRLSMATYLKQSNTHSSEVTFQNIAT
jgi:hypothetical protein